MKKNKENRTIPETEPEKEQSTVINEESAQSALAENDSEQKTDQVQADIEALNNEIAELKDKNLRLMAEFDNFRRRSLKERAELIKFAGEDVLKQVLPLVDDFERAIQAMESTEDANAVKEGIQLIYSKFNSFLSDSGVQVIPTQDVDFNTDIHEAVTTFPAPSEEQKGKIIDCLSKGYTLNEKVIRFAKVVVGE